MDLRNKHIVITGATSGLGLALLERLESANRISVIARPSARLETLRERHARVAVHEADLADIVAVERAADALARAGGKIDVLINNAAVQNTACFTDPEFRYENIRREIDTNFTSVCTLTHLLLPQLMAGGSATILNINSGLALAPKTGSAVYSATKAALNVFSQALGYQLEGTEVSVRQVFLPLVDTAMTEGRGTGKIPVGQAVREILRGLQKDRHTIDVGKVRLLRAIHRLSPAFAARVMKGA